MKRKYSKSITIAALPLLLAGCAGPKVTALDVEIARHQAGAQRACWAAQAIPAYADARDAALLVLAQALTGNPCKQTTVYEARAQIAASQNAAAGRIAGSIATAGIAATGIIAGADVLKAAFHNSGNQTSTTITGNNNTAAHYDTRVNNDYRIGTRGENSPASAASEAAGPDLHRTETTTITEAAP